MRLRQRTSQPALSDVSGKRSSSVGITVVEIHCHLEITADHAGLHVGDAERPAAGENDEETIEDISAASSQRELQDAPLRQSLTHEQIYTSSDLSPKEDDETNSDTADLISLFNKINILDNCFENFHFLNTQNSTAKHGCSSLCSTNEHLLGEHFRRRNSYKSDSAMRHDSSSLVATENNDDVDKPPLKISKSVDIVSVPRLGVTTSVETSSDWFSDVSVDTPASDVDRSTAPVFVTTSLSNPHFKPLTDARDVTMDLPLPAALTSQMQQHPNVFVSLSPVPVSDNDEPVDREMICIPKLHPAYVLFPEIIDVSKQHREYVCLPHSRSEGSCMDLPWFNEDMTSSGGLKETSSELMKSSLSAESLGDVSRQRKLRRGSHPLHNTGWERQEEETKQRAQFGLRPRSSYDLDLAQKVILRRRVIESIAKEKLRKTQPT